jgi:hypothetical protein
VQPNVPLAESASLVFRGLSTAFLPGIAISVTATSAWRQRPSVLELASHHQP